MCYIFSTESRPLRAGRGRRIGASQSDYGAAGSANQGTHRKRQYVVRILLARAVSRAHPRPIRAFRRADADYRESTYWQELRAGAADTRWPIESRVVTQIG